MPGTKSNMWPIHTTINGYSLAATTATLFLVEWVAPANGRIGAVAANGRTAGTGGGNTVLDILKNGTSVYTTTANRPTLAATSTGAFANTAPDVRSFLAGDVIALEVLSISSTGHAALSFTVAIEHA